jgi:hypothetical protein
VDLDNRHHLVRCCSVLYTSEALCLPTPALAWLCGGDEPLTLLCGGRCAGSLWLRTTAGTCPPRTPSSAASSASRLPTRVRLELGGSCSLRVLTRHVPSTLIDRRLTHLSGGARGVQARLPSTGTPTTVSPLRLAQYGPGAGPDGMGCACRHRLPPLQGYRAHLPLLGLRPIPLRRVSEPDSAIRYFPSTNDLPIVVACSVTVRRVGSSGSCGPSC